MNELKHGYYSTYTNYGCRCDACKAARAEHMRDYRARLQATTQPSEIPHGAETAYVDYGCRCAVCRAANAAARRKYRARKRLGGAG